MTLMPPLGLGRSGAMIRIIRLVLAGRPRRGGVAGDSDDGPDRNRGRLRSWQGWLVPDPDVSCSVVITTYNAQAYLGEQLEALARQTYPGPFEVVIADNGSTD